MIARGPKGLKPQLNRLVQWFEERVVFDADQNRLARAAWPYQIGPPNPATRAIMKSHQDVDVLNRC